MEGGSHEITTKERRKEGMMETEKVRFTATKAKEVLEKTLIAKDSEERNTILRNAGLNQSEESEIRVALGILRESDLRSQLELISLLSKDGKLAEATKTALILHLSEKTEKAPEKKSVLESKSETQKAEPAQEASPVLRVSLEEKKVIDAADAANPLLRSLFIEAVRIRKMKDREDQEAGRYALRREFYKLISEEAEKIEKELGDQTFSGKWGGLEIFDLSRDSRKPRIIRAVESAMRRWIGTETLKNEELAQKGLAEAAAESAVWKEMMGSFFGNDELRLLKDVSYLYGTLNRTLGYRLGRASWHEPRYTLTNMAGLTDTLLKNRDRVEAALLRASGDATETEKALNRAMSSAERIGAFLNAKSREEDIKIKGLIASHIRETAPRYREMVERLTGKGKEELIAELNSAISRAEGQEFQALDRALTHEHPFEALEYLQNFSGASLAKQAREEMRQQIEMQGPETFPVDDHMIELEIINEEASRLRKEAGKAGAEARRIAAGKETDESRELAARSIRLQEAADAFEEALKYRTLEIEVGL